MTHAIAAQLATISTDLRKRLLARDPRAELLLAEMLAEKLAVAS